MPSSRGSFQPKDQTAISCVSCIAGRFFTAEPLGKPCQGITGQSTIVLNGRVHGQDELEEFKKKKEEWKSLPDVQQESP